MYDIKFWLMINLGWQADLTVYVLSFEKKNQSQLKTKICTWQVVQQSHCLHIRCITQLSLLQCFLILTGSNGELNSYMQIKK